MAAISYSITRGLDGFAGTDFTHGTLAPNAGDIEIRINTADQNSVAINVMDIVRALLAFRRGVESETLLGGDWGV